MPSAAGSATRSAAPFTARPTVAATALAAVALAAAACGGDAPTPPERPTPAAIVLVDAAPRQGQVAEPVEGGEVAVRVVTAGGAGVAGVTVQWETPNGGTATPATATTDAAGQAAVRWQLGPRAGEQRLRARVAALPAAELLAAARPGPPAALGLTTAPADVRVGEPFRTQPVIGMRDRHGNPVAGVDSFTVTVELASGPGALTGTRTVTAGPDSLARFADLALDGLVGPRVLRFTSAGHAPVVSAPVLLRPAARATADRPDDRGGPQIHVVYAVPSDGADRGLDTLPTLAYSVASFQTWLAGASGGRALRLDTHRGALDVTFLRLAATDADVAARGAFVRSAIEQELAALGRLRPDKIYAVYYDGTSTYACGGASWPPQVPGRLAAMYLRGVVGGGTQCGAQAFVGGPADAPRYWESAMLHDLMHTLGIVSRQAPNHTTAFPAHVPEAADLMYTGPAPWQFGAGMVIDAGGDDYEGPRVAAGLPTLSASPFVTSAPPLLARAPGDRSFGPGWAPARVPAEPAWLRAPHLPPHPPLPGAW